MPAAPRRPPPPPRSCAGSCSPRCATAARSSAAKRSGYGAPVEVAIGAHDGLLLAATPAAAALRADPEQAGEREWLLVAAAVGALVELAEPGPPADAAAIGDRRGRARPGLPRRRAPGARPSTPTTLEELVPLAFDEQVEPVDRLKAAARAVPGSVLADVALRAPIGAGHPLRIAEAVARFGGRPADPRSVEEQEELVSRCSTRPASAVARPHEDPDPARRVARRILQRLNGMGKWGGYHTDFAHLARGFAGNERALAQEVGEALLADGLLAEKPSVGQRHVFLNPRRAADIHRLIETGETPAGLKLPVAPDRGIVPGMRIPSPGQVAGKLQTVATLARAGIVRPQRPDRLFHAASALIRWGATPAAGFKAAASRFPDDRAIIDEAGTLTFREVHERTNALAHALAAEGVGPGDRVAIMCRNHRGWVEAYVATNKLGGARAVHEHGVQRPAARRRGAARGRRRW